jgi:hypothetical protein
MFMLKKKRYIPGCLFFFSFFFFNQKQPITKIEKRERERERERERNKERKKKKETKKEKPLLEGLTDQLYTISKNFWRKNVGHCLSINF